MSSFKLRCVAVNCPNTSTVLHRFPKDYGRCHIWAERAGCLHLLEKGVEALNTNYRLCSDHFHDRCYSSTERKRLTNFAVPEIFDHQLDVTETRHQTENTENSTTSKRCRTCANVCENLIPIFGDRGIELQLPTKIHTHLPIMFAHCCLQADSILRTLLGVGFKDVTNEDVKLGEATQILGQATHDETVNQYYDQNSIQLDDIPSLEDCYEELGNNEKEMLTERDKFKVIVMKMKDNNESRDTQLEKALNVLKNIENVPKSLPVLSNEDTAAIDIKSQPDVIENNISMFLENNEEINQNNSSNIPVNANDISFYSGSCETSAPGKEIASLHEKTDHNDKLFCCPDCNLTIFESKELFIKHRETHLNVCSAIANPLEGSCLIEDCTSKNTEPISNKSDCNIYSETDQVSSHTVIPVQTEENEPKIISVANICIESENVPQNENPQNISKIRMKISKEFENIESNLQSKIIEAVKEMIQIPKNSNSKIENCSKNESCSTKQWKCQKCKYNASSWGEYIQHLQSHCLESLYCAHCNKEFNTKAKLKQHLYSHAQENKSFICEYCGKGFPFNQKLKIHLLTHGEGETMFECKECGKKLGTKGSYELHCSSHAEASYLCEICGKSLKYIRSLRVHQSQHIIPKAAKLINCIICGKGFPNRTLLGEHMYTHTNNHPFKCPHCNKSFQKRSEATEHLAVHGSVHPHKCPECGKGFNRLGNMKAHVQKHQTYNKFICLVCNETFIDLKDLNDHRKLHKEKRKREPPLSEGDCNKHMKTHFSQRKARVLNPLTIIDFTCIHCGQDFNEKDELDYHFEIAHTANVMIASDPMMINDETVVSLPPLGSCLETIKSRSKDAFTNFIDVIFGIIILYKSSTNIQFSTIYVFPFPLFMVVTSMTYFHNKCLAMVKAQN
ncbi:hypothetical protein C0J52_03806 [Blattella germanica]|nr:hypothetical protein C0J52_03806 [Blattella germanica]